MQVTEQGTEFEFYELEILKSKSSFYEQYANQMSGKKTRIYVAWILENVAAAVSNPSKMHFFLEDPAHSSIVLKSLE